MASEQPSASPEARPAVLFLIHDLRPGGAERVYLDYVRSMTRVRPVPVLVRPVGSLRVELAGNGPVYHLEDGGVEAHGASWLDESDADQGGPARDGALAGALSLAVKSRRLARIAERESAEVVSTFLHKSHLLALVAKLVWSRDLRVVVNLHEQPLDHLETHFPPSRRPWMRGYYRWLLPRADLVVAVSEGIRSELHERFGLGAELLAVARNPIDAADLRARAETPVPDGDLPDDPSPLVLAVGRLEPVKGFDLLLQAVRLVRRAIPMRLVLIGDGTERRRLEELVTSLDLNDVVTLLGYRENPLPHMARADVLVVSSLTEAWPTVVVEALALGTPVLATRCPGVEELLGGGRFGDLVASGDVEALAAGLEDLLKDAGRRRCLADLGPDRVRALEASGSVDHYEAMLASV